MKLAGMRQVEADESIFDGTLFEDAGGEDLLGMSGKGDRQIVQDCRRITRITPKELE